MRIVVATKNEHKRQEIQLMLADLSLEVADLNDLGINDDIEETGTTFLENACIKAKTISLLVDDIVMADDSGLEIDALGKEPGIFSARYLGHDTPYPVKNGIILKRMENAADRTARFKCAIALYQRGKQLFVTEEAFEGMIDTQMKGEHGFGYDPIFYYPPMKKSAAEMTPDEKNEVSHRGKAMKQLIAYLKENVI